MKVITQVVWDCEGTIETSELFDTSPSVVVRGLRMKGWVETENGTFIPLHRISHVTYYRVSSDD
jgi:hypothetical protein